MQRHARTRNGRCASTTVCLYHIAIQLDGILPQQLHVQRCAQRTAYQALNFQGAPALLATCRLAVHTGAGRTRQHTVLGRHPAPPRAFEESRHAHFNTRRANDFGIAKLHQYRAFGVASVMTSDTNFAQLIMTTLTGTDYRTDILHGASEVTKDESSRNYPASRPTCQLPRPLTTESAAPCSNNMPRCGTLSPRNST